MARKHRQDPGDSNKFNGMIAYLGGDPKDFEVKVRSVYHSDRWEVSLFISNLKEVDVAPIEVKITP